MVIDTLLFLSSLVSHQNFFGIQVALHRPIILQLRCALVPLGHMRPAHHVPCVSNRPRGRCRHQLMAPFPIRVEADLVDQLFNSSEKRLARLLLLLANFGKDEKPEPILAKISQETLADMIGTTRSRVSFFMNKFRKLGLIDYNGGIEVHSSLLNVVLHDEPHIRI